MNGKRKHGGQSRDSYKSTQNVHFLFSCCTVRFSGLDVKERSTFGSNKRSILPKRQKLNFDLMEPTKGPHQMRGNCYTATKNQKAIHLLDQQIQWRCEQAKQLEEAGNYEAAAHVLGDLWQGIGVIPRFESPNQRLLGELLLRIGSLTGWLGSVRQIRGAQETAKDIITKAVRLFDSIGDQRKKVEAEIELAWSYWRQGEFEESCVILHDALSRTTDEELKAIALVRLAEANRAAGRLVTALAILDEAAPLVESENIAPSLKGRFHNTLALVVRNLGGVEKKSSYLDRALIEYSAASYYFERAGHLRYCARVENNIGFLLFKLGRFAEAHAHLERARRLFASLRDMGSLAQVNETRARALLAQGRNSDAERVLRGVIQTLARGDEKSLLAEALATRGTALARLGRKEQARNAFTRALSAAEEVGDAERAANAALALIEELSESLSADELHKFYERADELLRPAPSEIHERLRRCARRIIAASRDTKSFASLVFVCASPQTQALLEYARLVAPTGSAVLIWGETGTGKDVLARLIHRWSGRTGQFVAVNCANLNDALFESQVFGHRRGSFTDAVSDYAGAACEAASGTLFLDEIGELSLAAQAKLLRLIEHGEVCALGAAVPERVDVRILAATNRDLEKLVEEGRFRADLFYRLATFQLFIPPLRERREDVRALAVHFIRDAERQHGKRLHWTEDCFSEIERLPLRGNARELRALIERTYVVATDGATIGPEAVAVVGLRRTQRAGFGDAWSGCSLEEELHHYEAELIKRALDQARGRITQAARLLGISHQRLSFILGTRHKDLLAATPCERRRRSIVEPKAARAAKKVAAIPVIEDGFASPETDECSLRESLSQ